MINFNGDIQSTNQTLTTNRAFKYGDAVFETLKVVKGNILFLEDHYFRLMASMRIIRMDIPMNFTMEFLEAEILKLLTAQSLTNSAARVRMTVYRDGQGFYTPGDSSIVYFIEANELKPSVYKLSSNQMIVDLFKDHYIAPQLLSTLKTTNRVLNVVAGIYASENDLDNCLLLNTNKQVVEAINGNIFLVKDGVIKTPPLADGCVKGIMRKQIIALLAKIDDYTLIEESISPFELQKADELFVTNVIQGIVSVTQYRKKSYANIVAEKLVNSLNSSLV